MAEDKQDRGRRRRRIKQALRGLRYGEVRVIVQDGTVVQLEKLERVRLRGSVRQRERALTQRRRRNDGSSRFSECTGWSDRSTKGPLGKNHRHRLATSRAD